MVRSILSIHLALMLASGKSWGGFRVRQRQRVLIMNVEDDHEEMFRRIYAAQRDMGLFAKDLEGYLVDLMLSLSKTFGTFLLLSILLIAGFFYHFGSLIIACFKSSKATWHSLDLFQSRPFFKRAVRGVALHKVKKIPSQERQGLELFFSSSG